ncbi:MAG: hypothetical protein QW511_04910 [Candidatus Methanomethylicia archaeon]
MGFVVFDDVCLWCRCLASFIRRVFGIEIVPLGRVVEDFGVKLNKGRMYVFDNGVNEGFKPLIKLIVNKGRLKSLRIIPSYIAYRVARSVNVRCGCNYSRRTYIRRVLLGIIFLVFFILLSIIWHDVLIGIFILFSLLFTIILNLIIYLIKPSKSKQRLLLLIYGYVYFFTARILGDMLGVSIHPFSRLDGLLFMIMMWTIIYGILCIVN